MECALLGFRKASDFGQFKFFSRTTAKSAEYKLQKNWPRIIKKFASLKLCCVYQNLRFVTRRIKF